MRSKYGNSKNILHRSPSKRGERKIFMNTSTDNMCRKGIRIGDYIPKIQIPEFLDGESEREEHFEQLVKYCEEKDKNGEGVEYLYYLIIRLPGRDRKYDVAVKYTTRAIAEHPDDAVLPFLCALLLKKLDRNTEAIEMFEKAQALDTKGDYVAPFASILSGLLEIQMGRHDEGLRRIRQSPSLVDKCDFLLPACVRCFMFAAMFLGKVEDNAEEAIQRFFEAIAWARKLNNLTSVLPMTELTEDAIKHFYSECQFEIALCYREIGEFVDSEKWFKIVEKEKANDSVFLREYASLKVKMEKLEEALALLDKAIYLNDKDPSSYRLRSYVFNLMGMSEKAMADSEKGLLYPEDATYERTRSMPVEKREGAVDKWARMNWEIVLQSVGDVFDGDAIINIGEPTESPFHIKIRMDDEGNVTNVSSIGEIKKAASAGKRDDPELSDLLSQIKQHLGPTRINDGKWS